MPDQDITILPFRVKVDGSTIAAFESYTKAGLYAASRLIELSSNGPCEVTLAYAVDQV
jgi:hypothetical protein